MSSVSEVVSGEETKVDLPPEKIQKTESDYESSDSNSESDLPPHEKKQKTESDLPPHEKKQKTESDYESDYEYDEDGNHEITRKELAYYCDSVRKSGGFDVINLPDVNAYGIIQPLYRDDKYLSEDETLSRCIRDAIKQYNIWIKNPDKHLEFVSVVKAMSQASRGIKYYITFDAKEAADLDKTNTYQAVVLDGLKRLDVQSFRLKPQDGGQGSSNHGQEWFWKEHCECDC